MIISAMICFGDLRNRVCANKPGVFQKAEAAFNLLLSWRIVVQHVFVAELGFIQLVTGDR